MTNRGNRRAERRAAPKRGPAARRTTDGRALRVLVFVAVAALIILALASTQFAVQPAVTPSPRF